MKSIILTTILLISVSISFSWPANSVVIPANKFNVPSAVAYNDTTLKACSTKEEFAAAWKIWHNKFIQLAGEGYIADNLNEFPEAEEYLEQSECRFSISFTFIVQDIAGEKDSIPGTFSVEQPEDIIFEGPADVWHQTCDFSAPESVGEAVTVWVLEQTNTIQATMSGGCNPEVYHNLTASANTGYEDRAVEVIWNIRDSCHLITRQAVFHINAPEPVTYEIPVDTITFYLCDLGRTEQEVPVGGILSPHLVLLENSISGGCEPEAAYYYKPNDDITPCNGGNIEVEWKIMDMGDTLSLPLTIIHVVSPPDLTKAYCTTMTVPECSLPVKVDSLFQTWKDGFTYTSDCGGNEFEYYYGNTIPETWRDSIDEGKGGTISYTYIVWGRCNNDEVTCEFVVPPCISCFDTIIPACSSSDQIIDAWSGWNKKFTEWAEEKQGTHNMGDFPVVADYIDGLLCGFEVCFTCISGAYDGSQDSVTGTFTVAAPQAISFLPPGDTIGIEIAHGQQITNADIFGWVNAHSGQLYTGLSGGCIPQVNAGWTDIASGYHSGDSIDVEWIISDICDTVYFTTTMYLTATDTSIYTFTPGFYEKPGDSASSSFGRFVVYPNPFDSNTRFNITSLQNTKAVLEIRNITGQLIDCLMDEHIEQDIPVSVSFQPVNIDSGIYIYRLIYDSGTISGRLIYRKDGR